MLLLAGFPVACGSTNYWRWGDDEADDVKKGSVNVVELAVAVAGASGSGGLSLGLLAKAFSGSETATSMPDADLVFAHTRRNGDTVEIEWKLSGTAQEDKRHAYILAAKVGKLVMVPKTFVLISWDEKMIYRNDMSWKPPPLPSKADSYINGSSFVLQIPESVISADEWKTVILAIVKADEDIELLSPAITLQGYFDYLQLDQTSTVIPESLGAPFLCGLLCLAGWIHTGQDRASLNLGKL